MKQSVKIWTIGLSALLCFALLAGCSQAGADNTQPVTTQPQQTTQSQNYKVEFVFLGETVSTQSLTTGMIPEEVFVEQAGIAMFGWVDETGERKEPFATTVEKDTVYTALAFPALRSHLPFLFVDENKCLRPDDTLTKSEMYAAVQAIVEPDAAKYLPPDNISADPAVDGVMLAEFMENFYPAPLVQTVFSSNTEPVTRAAFAKGMLRLLNFDESETLIIAPGAVLPTDITPTREDRIYLLEASVPHAADEEGAAWQQQLHYEPGFVNINGWLYYVTEEKTFLRNGYVKDFYFDSDGRYTSGDPELDQIVAQVLDTIIDLRPDAQPMDWLYAAYEYSRDSFKYLGRNNHKEIGKSDWGAEDAKVMLTTQRGNCYNYAAAFWALARGLGFDAQVMSGVVLKDRQDHGWVFLYVDGEKYLCDPEWEMVYRYERDDFTKDMFMLEMSEIGWWNYDWTP